MAKKIALRIAGGVPSLSPLLLARMPFDEIMQWATAFDEVHKHG